MTTWYPVTQEVQQNIIENGGSNNWRVAQVGLGHDLEYSSLMPKPGDYLRIKPSPDPNYFNELTFSFILDDCYDVVWISGKHIPAPYHWTGFGYTDCAGVGHSFGTVYNNDFTGSNRVNENIGKAFSLNSFGGSTGEDIYYTFRILGRNSGVIQSEYLIDDCNNILQEQTYIASFDGSMIQDAFRKTEQDYFTYYTPFIKIAGTYYVWKNLTTGYVVFNCPNITLEEATDTASSLIEALFNEFPELNEDTITPTSLAEFLESIKNNPVLEQMEILSNTIETVVQGVTGDTSLDILDIVEGFGDVLGGTFGDIGRTIQNVLDNFSLEVRQIINSVYNNNGDLLLGLQDYVKAIQQQNSNISLGIQNSNIQVSESNNRLANSLDKLLQSNITNPIEFGANLITFFVDLLFSRVVEIPIGSNLINSNIFQTVGDSFSGGIEKLYTGIQSGLEKLATGQIKDLNQFETEMENAGVSTSVFHLVQAIFSFVPLITTFLGVNLDPIAQNLRQASNAKFRPTLNDPSSLISAYYKGSISYDYLSKELAKHGLSDERIKVLLEAAIPLMSPGTIQFAYLRGILSEEEHDKSLRFYGYDNEQISTFKSLYQQIPPIQDLIRFSVREVFSPDIAQEFGIFEDYPKDLNQYIEPQGLSEFWGKAYWGAHWDLPSPTMGFQMLHRGIIDKETLRLLLRALDVMPFWREKVIDLSYNPLTRVDVRRMYQLGVINREQVKKSYLDLGYNETNAELMTQFTVTYEAVNSDDGHINRRRLTQNVILEGFQYGVIPESEALSRLINIGYTGEDARLLINIEKWQGYMQSKPNLKIEYLTKTATAIKDSYLRQLISRDDALRRLMSIGYNDVQAGQELNFIDYDYSVKFKSMLVASVKTLYTEFTITKNEAVNRFNSIGVVSSEQDKLFNEMDMLRELRDKKPTYAQFRDMMNKEIISKEEFYNELQGLGYADKYVDWLFSLETGIK